VLAYFKGINLYILLYFGYLEHMLLELCKMEKTKNIRRKVIRVRNSYIIHLPKKWAVLNNLRKGSIVNIDSSNSKQLIVRGSK
jgi:hypothetical protein